MRCLVDSRNRTSTTGETRMRQRLSLATVSLLFVAGCSDPAAFSLSDTASRQLLPGDVGGVGVPGRVPVWVDPSTLGNSSITERDSRIGIGTDNPVTVLHVQTTLPPGVGPDAFHAGGPAAGYSFNNRETVDAIALPA